MTCYGLEYFCFEGDGLWNSSRRGPDRAASRSWPRSAWPSREDVIDGCVVRQPKAYPVYDDDYAKHVNTIREELESNYPNLHLVGRNGMHKYNNQDHAMMTAMLCAENILAGETGLRSLASQPGRRIPRSGQGRRPDRRHRPAPGADAARQGRGARGSEFLSYFDD